MTTGSNGCLFAVFTTYFNGQNEAIKNGDLDAHEIPLIALGINNGWYDAIITLKAQIEFGFNNTYRQIITADEYANLTDTYNNVCLPLAEKCTVLTGELSECQEAYNTCLGKLELPMEEGADFDVYDVREPAADPFPPTAVRHS